jgi:hypothetical protein
MRKYNIVRELSDLKLVSREVLIKVGNNIEAIHNRESHSKLERWTELIDHVETQDQLMVRFALKVDDGLPFRQPLSRKCVLPRHESFLQDPDAQQVLESAHKQRRVRLLL